MTTPKNTAEAVAKVLGEPAFAEFSESVWKIRTNLIVVSMISIAVVFGGLHIDSDSQILGLKFKGLSDSILAAGLKAVVLYLLIHFVWAALDSFFEWRLRVTGTRVAFITTARLASEHGDYPSDPRHSTLYRWWTDQANKIGFLTERADRTERQLQLLEETLKARFTEGTDALNIVNAIRPITEARQEISLLRNEVKNVSSAIGAMRVPVSLERFDAWFELFLRSQNLRWLVIDFLAPVAVGAYALLLLTNW